MAVTHSATVTIDAPVAAVLEHLRDLDHQAQWFPGNLESEVLDRDAAGLPVRARMVNDAKVAKDEFVLHYAHTDTGFSWRLAAPTKVQKHQEGSWTLVDRGGRTEATMRLTLDAALPLPGFVQKRIVKATVDGAASALAGRFRARGGRR